MYMNFTISVNVNSGSKPDKFNVNLPNIVVDDISSKSVLEVLRSVLNKYSIDAVISPVSGDREITDVPLIINDDHNC